MLGYTLDILKFHVNETFFLISKIPYFTEDKTFAYSGSIFCYDFVAKVVPTGSNCSVTKDNTRTVLFYDSDNHNVSIKLEYTDRVVNATFDVSGSIQFCLQGLTQTDSGAYTNNCSSSSGITLMVIRKYLIANSVYMHARIQKIAQCLGGPKDNWVCHGGGEGVRAYLR